MKSSKLSVSLPQVGRLVWTKVPQLFALLIGVGLVVSCDKVEEEASFTSVIDDVVESSAGRDVSGIPVAGAAGDLPQVFFNPTDLAEPFRNVQSLLFADQVVADGKLAAEIMDPRGMREISFRFSWQRLIASLPLSPLPRSM